MSEYATIEEARAAKKPGEYICSGINLPYRVLRMPSVGVTRREYVEALIEVGVPIERLETALAAAGLETYLTCLGSIVIRTKEAGDKHRETLRREREANEESDRRHREYVRSVAAVNKRNGYSGRSE